MKNFKRVLIDKENKCEACSVADFNNDGKLEIVCGEYMYISVGEGKDFLTKTKICDITYDGNYVHDFSDYPLDVNGDGYPDIITGSWWSEGLFWRENPGKNNKNGGEWKTHKIDTLSNVETIRYFDIDNCGTVEIFPNCPNEPQCFFKLVDGSFKKYVIGMENAGHGMGFGDINGDSKTDIILSGGWLEQPDDVYSPNWKFHRDFNIPMASVPMLVYDVNGDGLNDLIVGAGHNFGLWWFEQKINTDDSTSNGVRREFIKHDIDTVCSQYHDMQLFDIDNDGELELITGARYFAHNGNDPGEKSLRGEHNPIGSYIFKIKKAPSGEIVFDKNTLDYGKPEVTSGMGIYFWLEDLTGNGLKDIVAPGKEGLYIFYNE